MFLRIFEACFLKVCGSQLSLTMPLLSAPELLRCYGQFHTLGWFFFAQKWPQNASSPHYFFILPQKKKWIIIDILFSRFPAVEPSSSGAFLARECDLLRLNSNCHVLLEVAFYSPRWRDPRFKLSSSQMDWQIPYIHTSHPGSEVTAAAKITCIGGPLDHEAVGKWGSRKQPELFMFHLNLLSFKHSDDLEVLSITNPDLPVYIWPLLFCFQLNIKKYLLLSVPSWIKHVSDEQIVGFVESLMVTVFKAASPLSKPELCPSALQGLSQAMKQPSPAYHLWSLLSKATGRIFDLLPNKIRVRNKNIYIPDNLCLGFFKAFWQSREVYVLRMWWEG